jgi:hypothetical protein
MRWKFVWLVLVPTLLFIAGGAFLLFQPDPDSINQANCDRIKVGMTEKEVVTILEKEWDSRMHLKLSMFERYEIAEWKGAQGTIHVQFSVGDGRVCCASYSRKPPPTLLEKIGNWLGW